MHRIIAVAITALLMFAVPAAAQITYNHAWVQYSRSNIDDLSGDPASWQVAGSWVVAGPVFVHGAVGYTTIEDVGHVEGVGSIKTSLESDGYSMGVGLLFDVADRVAVHVAASYDRADTDATVVVRGMQQPSVSASEEGIAIAAATRVLALDSLEWFMGVAYTEVVSEGDTALTTGVEWRFANQLGARLSATLAEDGNSVGVALVARF